MAGHSKWSKIKRQKEITDRAKGATFAKLSRLITLAVIEGGGRSEPEHNVKLRLAIEKARQLNMPKENITRAIEKGSGPDKQNLKEVIYEAFGPHGVGLLITATTDNSNRTFAEIKNLLERNGGKIGAQGSVSYLFQKNGVVTFDKNIDKENGIFNFAERIGAGDIVEDSDTFIVFFPFDQIGKVKEYAIDIAPQSVEVIYRPLNTIPISEVNQTEIIKLIEALENLDDVQEAYSNAEFTVN